MTLSRKLRQLFIVGFHGTKVEDPWVKKVQTSIQKGELGGVIIYGYNVENRDQLTSLTHFLKKDHPPSLPPFIAIDQEGGRVQRLRSQNGFSDFPSPFEIVSKGLDAEKIYSELAAELVSAGVNLNFAPCIDVNPLDGSLCPVIGGLERSYGNDPIVVADYGKVVCDAFRSKGLLSCLKHFPGHGSAKKDSHKGFVDVTSVWEERELDPFFRLIEEGKGDMIMTAHIFNSQLDSNVPATFSSKTLNLLRKKGYDGVIISDDLHMGAIQERYDGVDACVKALNAGCDMIILSNNEKAAPNIAGFSPSFETFPSLLEALEDAVSEGAVSSERIEEAYRRVQELKKRLV